MSLETSVVLQCAKAIQDLGKLHGIWTSFTTPLVLNVSVPGAVAATAELREFKTAMTSAKTAARSGIAVKLTVPDVQKQAEKALNVMRKLQKSSAAINVQATVGEAVKKLNQVLAIVQEIKQHSSIVIKVDVPSDGAQKLGSIHQRLTQLRGAGVNWSDTQKQAAASGAHWSTGLGGLYNKLVMVGRGIASLAVVVRTLQGAYQAIFGFSNLLAQTNVGLTTLFDGNQAKADKLLATLKQYAIPTPFAMADLAPLSQQAIAFGLVDKQSKTLSKDLTSLFDDVGNAAYGLGKGKEGIDRIMLAFGQMTTATRIMGQDMLQLQSVGVNAWKYLAEATGKSTGEVRKMVEEGLIPAEEGIKAIREGLREDFWGGMTRGAKTLEGALSQIQDSIHVLTAGALSSFYEDITKKAQDLTAALSTPAGQEAVSAAINKVIEILTALGNIIIWLAGIINDKWQYIVAGLLIIGSVKMVTGIMATVAALGALATPILIAAAAVVAFIAAYRNIDSVRYYTKAVVGGVIGILGELSHYIGLIMGELSAIPQMISGWLKKIPDFVFKIMPNGTALKAFRDTFTSAFDNMDFRGAEKSADKFWLGVFDKWDLKGSKLLENTLTGSITGNFGIDKIIADIQKQIAKVKTPQVGKKPGGIVAGSLGLTDGEADDLKKNLATASTYWDDYSKSVESAAQRQIDAIKGVANSITGLVDSLKNDLIKNGILNDPLQASVAKLMRDMNLQGQALGIAQGTAGQLAFAGAQSQQLKSTSGATGDATGTAAKIAASAITMQANGATESYARMCQKLARETVQKVTSKFDKFWAGSAAATMKNFQRAGVGFAAGKNYKPQPGDIVYTDGSVGKGYGHVQVVGSRGNYNDQYGSHSKPTTRPQWIVRPDGSGSSHGGDAVATASGASNAMQAIKNLLSSAASIPVRGSNVHAVPEQWMWAGGGKAVTDAPGNQARFKFQEWLTTQQGHDWFQSMAAQTSGGKMAVAQKFRGDLNNIDIARNTANIKVATDATEDFILKKRQEILAMREGTEWLKNNTYNSQEYAKAMDIAKAKTQAETEVRKSGIPISAQQEQIAKRVKIATQAINDALRSSAFTEHIKRVADLDKQYVALHDTTIQQIATRKVLSREDAAQLTAAEKQLEIQKEIRNVQADYAAQAVTSLRKGNLDAQFALLHSRDARDPVTQLRNATALQDAQRRLIDPAFSPTWDMILERSRQVGLAISQWKLDSKQDAVKSLNDLLRDTAINSEKVAAFFAQHDSATAGDANAYQFSPVEIDKVVSAGLQGDLKEKLDPLKTEIKSFVDDYYTQIDRLANADNPVYESELRIRGFQNALGILTSTARANGFGDLADQIDQLSASVNQLDPQKIIDMKRAIDVDKEATRIADQTTLTRILDPVAAAFAQWKMNMQQNNFTDADIEKLIPAQKILMKAQEVRSYLDTMVNGVSSSLNNAFQNLFESGPKHFFRNLLAGLTDMLNQMATQIITSTAMKYLTQLVSGASGGMGGGGGIGGGVIGAITSFIVPAIMGGGGGGGGFSMSSGAISSGTVIPGFATGLPTVPYDNFPAMLHRNEAVLTAQQAQDWRQQQRDMARMPTSGSASRQAGGNITVVQQYHIAKVVANDPQQFAKKLPGKSVATGELQRSIYQAARKGQGRI